MQWYKYMISMVLIEIAENPLLTGLRYTVLHQAIDLINARI